VAHGRSLSEPPAAHGACNPSSARAGRAERAAARQDPRTPSDLRRLRE